MRDSIKEFPDVSQRNILFFIDPATGNGSGDGNGNASGNGNRNGNGSADNDKSGEYLISIHAQLATRVISEH